MTQETRNFVTEKVQAILAAPSCCPELKEIGMEWKPRDSSNTVTWWT